VGGGFEASPGGIEQTTVTESRLASPTSWVASAIRSAPLTTSNGTVTALVECRLRAPKLKTISASAQMPGAAVPGSVSTGTATASCPKNLRALSGGFTTSVDKVTTLGVIPQESRRAKGGRAWQASAVHNNTSPRTVTAYAYCAKPKVGQRTDQVSLSGDLD